MFEDLHTITLSGREYPIKCDLVVLEKIQSEFGSIEKFEFGIMTGLPVLDANKNPVIDEETGKEKVKGKFPNITMVNKALFWMISEGEEIAAQKAGRKAEIIKEVDILRAADMTPSDLANAIHDEFYRCLVGKNPETTQDPEEAMEKQ